MGYKPKRLTRTQAIKKKCIDCCGGGRSNKEVEYCTAYKCPLWRFRTGKETDYPDNLTEDDFW